MDQPGTRIQWGQAFVVLSMIMLSWWTATQWTAWELAFQPELGRPWFTVLHRWPVYAPPLFFWWWYEFDAYAPAAHHPGFPTVPLMMVTGSISPFRPGSGRANCRPCSCWEPMVARN